MNSLFDSEFAQHMAVAEATRAQLRDPFVKTVAVCVDAIRGGGKLLFFGNGGSAADAQHLATELTIRYRKDRPAIAAIALTTDSSALTAAGNDMGFEQIFARQIEALGKPGDVAIGITTSGRSPNVVRALEVARAMGLKCVAFTGGTGGDMPRVAENLLLVPSDVTARIQEMHITLGQMLCAALEIELGLVSR
ncbi:MAG: D-sedoheptulose 7-phosphate isomerase [Alphaproteobacteria bacterium]|nr:D-sedoheptulose 7-phosphate isomerase [Alphaproteobacteria bacterium]